MVKLIGKLANLALIASCTTIAFAGQAVAEKRNSESAAIQRFAENGAAEDRAAEQTPATSAPQKTATDPDEGWHFAVSPYLWLAGMHGTVGAFGHEASVHASFGDIIKNLNMGLMAAGEARRNKVGIPLDFMWMKLSDDKASPFERGPTSAKAEVTQTMVTPKVAYRLVGGKMVTVDGTFGIRYYHLGTTLEFEPTGTYRSFYQSANWVDYVGGGRFIATLSPKIVVTVVGDAGAGGANLDYQLVGVLGYKVKPSIILQTAWRYMDVNYRPSSSSSFVYDVTTDGLLIGATFDLK